MASLGTTIANLARYKRTWANRLATAELRAPGPGPHLPSPLEEVTGFGSNPGELTMLTYVPAKLANSPALVVVLHGCTQTAAEYDLGAGWSTLADRHGFALLLPEQRRDEQSQDSASTGSSRATPRRDRGEALSIRQMVERMVRPRHRPEARFRHRPVGRRRHDLGHARHLSGGLCGRRHHRRPALRLREQCRQAFESMCRRPPAHGEGMGRPGARRFAASGALAARVHLARLGRHAP